MSQIFLSYKREERPQARAIAAALIAEGYDVWWDVELLPGDSFLDEIETVIKNAKAAIVLWSESAINSPYVKAEAKLAFDRDTLISASLDGTLPPFPFNGGQSVSLVNWLDEGDEDALRVLLAGVTRKVGEPQNKQQPKAVVTAKIKQEETSWKTLWAAIRDLKPESIKEYQHFLDKYRADADAEIVAFADRRIKHLRRAKPASSLVSAVVILATLAGAIFTYLSFAQRSNKEPQKTAELGSGQTVDTPASQPTERQISSKTDEDNTAHAEQSKPDARVETPTETLPQTELLPKPPWYNQVEYRDSIPLPCPDWLIAWSDKYRSDITFTAGRAFLDGKSANALSELSDRLKQCPYHLIRIEGHTSSSGPAQANQELSENRAHTVATYLKANGVDSRRITHVGYGETKPIDDNNNAIGQANNRRIDFIFTLYDGK